MRRLEIEVGEDELQPHIEKMFKKYQRKVQIQGFRKGKVPLTILQKRFGDAIRADIADELVQTFFKQAVEQEKIPIVSAGKVKDLDFEEGKPLTFSVEVEVEPDVQIEHYKGIKVEKESAQVTSHDVQQALLSIQEQKAELITVQYGAEKGYIVEGDVQALDTTGVPIIGKKWENRIFELGTPPLGDVVEDQLLGVVEGEERRFKISHPEQGSDGSVRDIEDHYSIRVTSVKEKRVQELNDDFAKSIGEFQTLSELEQHVEKQLKTQRDRSAERLLRHRIADAIIKQNDFEIPPSMVDNTLDGLWEDQQKRQGEPVDEETFREENRSGVIWNLKWHLIWRKIAEVEGIRVEDEDVDAEVDKMAAASPEEEKKIRILFKEDQRRKRLTDELLENRVMDLLKENAKIKEVTSKRSRKEPSRIVT